ncbi:hypothetical protein A2223_03380 [Candidatus Falkowbacteria bacterium RIFOXYA2_FULL_35_8]|uniref:Radical SAM core domain-containing protein n=1 Tax=Candidatus Falkowbacteria bacterium RIFOXYC2_FULL_36_12 TaxID=1798002 RepID=A0A1F5SYJ2_9BACT|nr:MAG: hypothetical protein A2300_01935 [Candidatus Falkowbacteria bacterium RIFOXYB2_FULL_35_7]OGF31774.1 MAG: hypothetical protein A2478_04790 [Candidatus Falkowbacteria bacterium RIFOXYC2_FULL_36_12]OGF33098.1 MAG: hypothetical protein A2223_03380 [Candidatus Falkowbacteria bacterium RIFOXYA2_FULL_35_8]
MVKKFGKIWPIDAVVAVTYRCNARCVMCNIWQIKDFPEIQASEYLKLPATLKDVNISGGEPFLRQDLFLIVKNIKEACPRAHIVISSNGFLVETIKRLLPEIKKIDPDIGLNISIDGIEESQERIRRVAGGWQKNLEVIRFAKDLGLKDLGIGFTLNNENYSETEKVYDFCLRNKLNFSIALAQSSDFYFGGNKYQVNLNKEQLQQSFSFVINKLLKSYNPKNWARAFFVDGLMKISEGKRRPLESKPGDDFFYLDPKGDIYPSVIDNVIMGNITKFTTFDGIWLSAQAEKARIDIKGYESNYWFVCTARTAIMRNPLKVARWIFDQKISGAKSTISKLIKTNNQELTK